MSTAKKYFPATASGKEKSRFTTTCNRLSSFLKEKGSLRDLRIDENFDVKGKSEISSPATATATENKAATIDLLSVMETTVQTTENSDKSINRNRLPQYINLDSFCEPEPAGFTNSTGSGEPVAAAELKTAQMTIFYGSQVLVFDYVSADKARDLILAASGVSDNQIQNRIQSASTSISHREGLESHVNGSDLPIARRASLHRFLAKRKDRAAERGPYQLHNPLMAAASLNHKFDLNL